MSRSISLRAFCTAVPASPLVEVLDQQLDLAAENAALGIDLLERKLRADQLVLAERGVGAGERVVETDLDSSAARAVTTNGEAICSAPAAAAVFNSVRRSSFIDVSSYGQHLSEGSVPDLLGVTFYCQERSFKHLPVEWGHNQTKYLRKL